MRNHRFCVASIVVLLMIVLASCTQSQPTSTSETFSTPLAESTVVPTTSSPNEPTATVTERQNEVPQGSSEAASAYSDLPQSQTPEGYYVLGDPAAPTIMTHYSDFL
jgi:hypothetical protein